MKDKAVPVLVLVGAVILVIAAAGGFEDIGPIVAYLVGIALYFLPTIAALRRKVPNQGSVIVINAFFGWTVIGWVIALAMAFRDPKEA